MKQVNKGSGLLNEHIVNIVKQTYREVYSPEGSRMKHTARL
jgi:hypothetical protein